VLRDGAKLEVRVSDELSLESTSDLIQAAMHVLSVFADAEKTWREVLLALAGPGK
jgi:hypothetical protein